MRTRLPPLDTLRIFEVVMRRGSIKQAADELCLTPQAVSQRLKLLESHLQQPLFDRDASRITPTPGARELLMYIQEGLSSFQAGVQAIQRQGHRQPLRLYVSPYFATKLLMPNLAGFLSAHPELDIKIVQGTALIDPGTLEFDAVIHWGLQERSEAEKLSLIDDLKVIVVSPRLLPEAPQDLHQILALPRVTSDDVDFLWQQALDLLGLALPWKGTTCHIDTNSAMAEAVMGGVGIGLISYADAIREIRLGRLVAPFGCDLLRGLPAEKMPRFTLLYSRSNPQLPLLRQFAQWLQSEVCRDEAVGYPSKCRTVRAATASG